MSDKSITIHWFRRDLRLNDNISLNAALESGRPVLCLFIFDTDILDKLPKDDARVSFIHETISDLHEQLKQKGSGMLAYHGKPIEIWKKIIKQYDIHSVFTNRDYEPYGVERDKAIGELLEESGIEFQTFKDHVIFEPGEVMKDDGDPYTVYTPYKNKWYDALDEHGMPGPVQLAEGKFYETETKVPGLGTMGFVSSSIKVPPPNFDHVGKYDELRDDPEGDYTTHLGPHLRFGTVSIRRMSQMGKKKNTTFLDELIWREFFMQILYHFPRVVNENFKTKYNDLEWRNNEEEFEKWCKGKTGYPMVDAGMRQLNETGYMHNRVRMVVASFLCKHLLIDWRWGEAYFAEKLLDYELSSNNGNWQWAAGTGCDAAPYFRIFNPKSQLDKYDPDHKYVRRWLPDLDSFDYPDPVVEHKAARERALETYKAAVS